MQYGLLYARDDDDDDSLTIPTLPTALLLPFIHSHLMQQRQQQQLTNQKVRLSAQQVCEELFL